MAQHQTYSKIEHKILKTNISHTPFWCSKLVRITFSSDLRKPYWITGESLSPQSKKCPVLENNHIYIKISLVKVNVILQQNITLPMKTISQRVL